MHKGLLLAGVACSLATTLNLSAQTAPTPIDVRLICKDLLVLPAKLRFFGGIEDENHISSQGRFQPANDELQLAPNNPTTHWGTFFYVDGQTFEVFPMNFDVNVPTADANQNGVWDILEYGQSVAATQIFGTYLDPDGFEGDFLATWSKSANSHIGTLRIEFDFTTPSAFVHSFQALNYSGTMPSPVKEGSTVHGNVSMTRAGVPTSKLSGDLALSVDQQQGQVSITSTSFKDENEAVFGWAPLTEPMQRDGSKFSQMLAVVDGWLAEPTPDFWDWLVVIEDKNDGDGDGLPDLIDPPSVVTATAPTMQIIKTDNGIRLLITGDVGRAYTLESASAIPAATWSNPTAVTLTASPHTLDLPAPTAATYWRMRFP